MSLSFERVREIFLAELRAFMRFPTIASADGLLDTYRQMCAANPEMSEERRARRLEEWGGMLNRLAGRHG